MIEREILACLYRLPALSAEQLLDHLTPPRVIDPKEAVTVQLVRRALADYDRRMDELTTMLWALADIGAVDFNPIHEVWWLTIGGYQRLKAIPTASR